MGTKRIFALLPCYNEEENIALLIEGFVNQRPELEAAGYSLRVVAIDDCSTDGTKKVIEGCAATYDDVELLPHEVNKGLCGGLNSAIEYSLKNGSEDDVLLLMDGDNTHDPKYMHEMLGKLSGGVECVIASRYSRGADVVGVAAHRVFLSDMARYYYKMTLKVPNVQDYTCGYRIYTYAAIRRLVDKFGEDPIKEQSFACMMELLYKLYLTGTSFDEVGFVLRYDNKRGTSKMQVLKTMEKSLVTALKLRRLRKR